MDSIFFPEHTHIPVSRRTPYPAGGELPKEYSNTYDPFVTLGSCAAVTERIKLGTGICLVVERDVITLAKEISTLDRISDGRFILGIGAGWNAEEMENHGIEFKNRWKIVREKVLAMKNYGAKRKLNSMENLLTLTLFGQNPNPFRKEDHQYGWEQPPSGVMSELRNTATGGCQ